MALLASAAFSAALDVSAVRAPYARARIPVAADPAPGGDYRDLRVRDDRGKEIPYALDPGPRTWRTVEERAAPSDTPASDPATQIARVDLGTPNAVASVRIATTTPAFARDVLVERSDDDATWSTVTNGRVERFREGAPHLTLVTDEQRARYWRVIVDDRDDAALDDLRVVLLVQAHEVVFPVVRGRHYALAFGDPNLDAPVYDLPVRLAHEHWLAERASVGRVVELRRRTPDELASAARRAGIAPAPAAGGTPAWLTPVAFGAAVVVLALFALRLARMPEAAGPEGD